MPATGKHHIRLTAPVAALASLVSLAAWQPGCRSGSAPSPQIMLFAASSLGDALVEIGVAFERGCERPCPVRLNLAGSNVLAQQILAAPRADLFLSANEQWMDVVERAGRLVEGTRRPILSNRLVVVAHPASDYRMDEAADLARIPFRYLSVANPEGVPAGIYAKRFLQAVPSNGGTLWGALAPRVVPAANVRAALALVEADPSAVGLVYRTDAATSSGVRVLYQVAGPAAPAIRYSLARVRRARAPETAEQLFEFLSSEAAVEIFERNGFAPLASIASAG